MADPRVQRLEQLNAGLEALDGDQRANAEREIEELQQVLAHERDQEAARLREQELQQQADQNADGHDPAAHPALNGAPPLPGQQPPAPADPQLALARAMTILAGQMELQNNAAAQNRPLAQAPARLEAVKIQPYDGKTDVEDFIRLFDHLVLVYNWPVNLRVAKLKTALVGQAAECGNQDTVAGIYAALRAKFGITAEEAKRSLTNMKPGYTTKLKDLADRIAKLTLLAYPDLPDRYRDPLALDQFRKAIHPDLDTFLVSRPPHNLLDAVQFCKEFIASGGLSKSKKVQISSAHLSPLEDGDPTELNAFEVRPLTHKDLKHTLTDFQKSMAECMKQMMTTCAEAIQTGVNKAPAPSFPTPKPATRKPPTSSKPTSKPPAKKLPPTPCTCGEMHWYKDCPKRPQDQSSSNSKPTPASGNATGPQQ